MSIQVAMSNDQIARVAPSVFAVAPFHAMSERYRFVPTIQVVDKLRSEGFFPVSAGQGRTRIPGKGDFTRHVLRFRQDNGPAVVGELPEIVLLNSHDGSSSYQLHAGLFRLVCSNGMVVASQDLGSIRVTHSGARDLADQVVDASYQIIEETPAIMSRVGELKTAMVSAPKQIAFASAALELRGTTLDVQPESILRARRYEDRATVNGERSVWDTLNVVQEHLVRGGARGRTSTGRRSSLRAIGAPAEDVKFNRALWRLAEELKKAA